MNDLPHAISSFVSPIALIMALVLVVNLVNRNMNRQLDGNWVLGVIFAAGLLLTMSDPIDLGEAGIFDTRGLLIGTAAAFFGPRVALIVLATGLTYRWVIGGPGMIPGFVVMFIAYGAGLAWRYLVQPRIQNELLKSTLLGVMISFQMLAILLSPPALQASLFQNVMLFIAGSNILGAILVNHLILNEMNFLEETANLRTAARTDPMTGLLNRRGLQESYDALPELESPMKGMTVAYFDLDHFKTINDKYGHANGDLLLREVAQRVCVNLRPQDLFCRLGGDEFAIVLHDISVPNAKKASERCRLAVSESPILINDTAVDVSISLGAIWMIEKGEMDAALDAADMRLYDAKTMGRNRVVFEVPSSRIKPAAVEPAA